MQVFSIGGKMSQKFSDKKYLEIIDPEEVTSISEHKKKAYLVQGFIPYIDEDGYVNWSSKEEIIKQRISMQQQNYHDTVNSFGGLKSLYRLFRQDNNVVKSLLMVFSEFLSYEE